MIEKNFSVEEVAKIFLVTEWTVREWLKNPDHPLVGHKPEGARKWVIPESNVKKVLESKHG